MLNICSTAAEWRDSSATKGVATVTQVAEGHAAELEGSIQPSEEAVSTEAVQTWVGIQARLLAEARAGYAAQQQAEAAEAWAAIHARLLAEAEESYAAQQQVEAAEAWTAIHTRLIAEAEAGFAATNEVRDRFCTFAVCTVSDADNCRSLSPTLPDKNLFMRRKIKVRNRFLIPRLLTSCLPTDV